MHRSQKIKATAKSGFGNDKSMTVLPSFRQLIMLQKYIFGFSQAALPGKINIIKHAAYRLPLLPDNIRRCNGIVRIRHSSGLYYVPAC